MPKRARNRRERCSAYQRRWARERRGSTASLSFATVWHRSYPRLLVIGAKNRLSLFERGDVGGDDVRRDLPSPSARRTSGVTGRRESGRRRPAEGTRTAESTTRASSAPAHEKRER